MKKRSSANSRGVSSSARRGRHPVRAERYALGLDGRRPSATPVLVRPDEVRVPLERVLEGPWSQAERIHIWHLEPLPEPCAPPETAKRPEDDMEDLRALGYID